jgi:hypothetical protein
MLRRAIFLSVVCGTGCQSPTDPAPLIRLGPESLDPIAQEWFSGFTERARWVVRDVGQWVMVWDQTYAGYSEPPPQPAVDFSSDMILVAALGDGRSSSSTLSIERVVSRDAALVVDVVERVPGPDCFVLAVITNPVVMVRVPAFSGRVVFKERRQVLTCD